MFVEGIDINIYVRRLGGIGINTGVRVVLV